MQNKINQLEKQSQAADRSRSLQCWWMLAGVVDYKLCDHNFDCEHCPFDKAIHGSVPQSAFEIEESISDKPAEMKLNNTAEFTNFQEYKLSDALFYHPSHIWMRVEEGGCVRVGLDDFGQRVLGRIYSVTLPAQGNNIVRNEGNWKVTHQVGETTLIAPVSGTVKKVNTKLAQYPSLLNREPYGEGWAFVIEPTDLDECLKDIFYGQKVKGWYKSEVEKLYAKANEVLSTSVGSIGQTMPDGGMLMKDFMSELDADEMLQVISSFFPASSSREEEASNKFFAMLDQKRR